jgi:hypothetical protein
VDESIWLVALAISFIASLMLCTPEAAFCMFDEISRVAALCSSTADAILAEISLILAMTSLIPPIGGKRMYVVIYQIRD